LDDHAVRGGGLARVTSVRCRLLCRCWLVPLLLSPVYGVGIARAQEPQQQDDQQAAARAEALPDSETVRERLKGLDLALPQGPPTAFGDAEVRAGYREAMHGYYNYRIRGYDHRLRAFEWQALSSKIIFFVVILLVFVGIYFAAIQFHRGAGSGAEQGTELELSLRSVKVSSPVLGVVILVISLAFFYLYLWIVYPISNEF